MVISQHRLALCAIAGSILLLLTFPRMGMVTIPNLIVISETADQPVARTLLTVPPGGTVNSMVTSPSPHTTRTVNSGTHAPRTTLDVSEASLDSSSTFKPALLVGPSGARSLEARNAEGRKVGVTEGKFGDEFRSGNDVIHIAASEFKSTTHHYGSFINKTTRDYWLRPQQDANAFESVLERVGGDDKKSKRCYYYVRNFCVENGSLRLFSSGKQKPHTKGGDFSSFRLCNELRGKLNLRYSISPVPTRPPFPLSNKPAHLAACWQFYGFHLFQCLASMFAAEAELKLSNVHLLMYNHAQSFPKEQRDHYSHQLYMGSSASWIDPKPTHSLGGEVKPSSFWQLWSQNTASPADVHVVKKFGFPNGLSQCYNFGIIGSANHHGLSISARRGHALRLREALGLEARLEFVSQPRASTRESVPRKRFTVLLCQRFRSTSKLQGARKFLNADAVIEAINGFQDGNVFNATVVDWAAMPVADQAKTADSGDIMISMHGAGNSWLVLQRPRSVLIEVWPDCVARNVYVALAQQYNIRYYALCQGQKGANFLHANVKVDIALLEKYLKLSLEYLNAVSGL